MTTGTGNTRVWDALNRPPASALKEIRGGRLKGMTDINPQWRYRALTEQFGPCGIGWKFSIDNLWTEPAGDEVFAFARVSLYVKLDKAVPFDGDEWSEPVPGVGGSKLLSQERSSVHGNDEAYKMAVTDALSTAGKMLGVAADIYMGLWDGAKYIVEDDTQAAVSEVIDRKKMRHGVQETAQDVFGDKIDLPADYTEFTRLCDLHKGVRGINDLRAVGKIASDAKWPEGKLLEWIKAQKVDLDNGAKTSDFARLRFEIEREVKA